MSQALLIVDIQNDYFPGGAMELVGADAAAAEAAALLSAFRSGKLPVVHMQHVSTRPGATFFLPGTEGGKIHDSVVPLPGETVFQKHYPNSFRETPLLHHLRGLKVDSLVVVGMMTHMCIDTSTRAAADLGFKCTLAHDACATRELVFESHRVCAADVQASYLAALNGTFAKVLSTADVLAAI